MLKTMNKYFAPLVSVT